MNITAGRATPLSIEAEACLAGFDLAYRSPAWWRDRAASLGVDDFAGTARQIEALLKPSNYSVRKSVFRTLWEAMPKADGGSEAKSGAWQLQACRLTEDVPDDLIEWLRDEAMLRHTFLPGIKELREIVDPVLFRRRACLVALRRLDTPDEPEPEPVDYTPATGESRSISRLVKHTVAQLEAADRALTRGV